VRNPGGAANDVRRKEVWPVDAPATYLSWGFILISVPNLLMILGMIVVFVAALLAPFPHRGSRSNSSERHHD